MGRWQIDAGRRAGSLWGALVLTVLAVPPLGAREIRLEPGKQSLDRAAGAGLAGDTLVLSAGTFSGSVRLPAGVSLRGAGHGKTTLDAGPSAAAITLAGKGSRVEDLTIQTRGSSAIAADGASDFEVRRVRILGGALGIQGKKVTRGRIENTLIVNALVGVSLNRARKVAVVNCTLVNATSIGLSLIDVEDSAVFNNVVADAGTAVLLDGRHKGLHVDHNLHRALFAGKVEGEMARVSLGPWRDVSGGLDASSVNLPVAFAGPQAGDYRPVSVLDWAPGRLTTADWGVPELGGFKAPTKDIDGRERQGAFDLGVYETPARKAPEPDGTFEVSADEGTKSAGVFDKDGKLVRYLFHDLPLKKGKYGFRLPSRSQLGEPIPAGDYEVRVVESQLGWKYRGITGNTGVDSARSSTDQNHTAVVRFAPDGALLMGNGWNERGENVRSRDLRTGKTRWVFNGMAQMDGLCVGGDGRVYCLRGAGKDTWDLSRIDAKTGQPLPWKDGKPTATVRLEGAVISGMAELDGKLYLADPKNSRIYRAPLDNPVFEAAGTAHDPALIVADRKHRLLWMLSGNDKVIALAADKLKGPPAVVVGDVKAPVGVAVRVDRLAIASAVTGKIHFFDCSRPDKLEAKDTVGRGDGPYGVLRPDRFHFQLGPYNEQQRVSLDLGPRGQIALRDVSGRIVVLDSDGKALYASISQFGNQPTMARLPGDERPRAFDHRGRFSWFLDPRAGRWEPDAYWGLPAVAFGMETPLGYFSDKGKTFGIFHSQWLNTRTNQKQHSVLLVRFKEHLGRPVLLYTQGEKGWIVLRDTNQDGMIDEKDAPGELVKDSDGKPITWPLMARWMFADPDGHGDFRTTTAIGKDGMGFVWKYKGLDKDDIPTYSFAADQILHVNKPVIPSPYNFSLAEDVRGQSESLRTKDGRLAATFQFGHSPRGMALSNSGGTDLALFGSDGGMRWLRPLNDFAPIQGIKPMGKGFLTSWGHQAEWIGLDEDGLGLGHLGFPAEAHWTGMWVDHPGQYLTFEGNDGKVQVLCGDYMVNGTHWMTLEHTDYKKASFPFRLDAKGMDRLASEPAVPFRLTARPAPPRVLVRRLPGPLPIDGDLEKWRKAGITPQILVTPATASGAIDGPRDASAVIRIAYEGQNLYVQVLRFDDVVTFHQPVSRSHLQDTVEIMLNGFADGFQWSVSNFTDAGPAMVRRRFFFGKLEDRTPAKHAPRVVKVLDNARAVSERSLIETAYGVDLSDCKVIVTEFKLPIDKVSYKGSEQSLFAVRPGASFWLGFMIDDNDVPGADVQDFMVWPASYGTFGPKEDGALAVFE
jgi:hypothetical protein